MFVNIIEFPPIKRGHENEDTFMAMHTSEERQKAWEKVEPLLEGSPEPDFYNVIITSEKKK